jgi:hypothetical protein
MSRYHRCEGLWPSDIFAVHVWHTVAALEDTLDLVEASKAVASEAARTALIKKALVELKAFDDLVAEFGTSLRGEQTAQLDSGSRIRLEQAVKNYHRAVQPSRGLLADIRNTLGAHRRGLPGDGERKRFGSDFRAWGEWEQRLASLEAECTLSRWIDFVNSAIALRNEIARESPGAWFSFGADGEFRLFFPIRPG